MATIKLLTFVSGTSATYSIDGGDPRNATVDGDKVTIDGYGTFDLTTLANTEFVADAGLTGELVIDITDISGAKLVKADFSKAAGGVKFEGKDGQTVTFGTGADTLVQKSGNKVTVAGYN